MHEASHGASFRHLSRRCLPLPTAITRLRSLAHYDHSSEHGRGSRRQAAPMHEAFSTRFTTGHLTTGEAPWCQAAPMREALQRLTHRVVSCQLRSLAHCEHSSKHGRGSLCQAVPMHEAFRHASHRGNTPLERLLVAWLPRLRSVANRPSLFKVRDHQCTE